MPERDTQVQLRDAERIVDALNQAMDVEGTVDDRAEFLLRGLIDLLAQPSFAALLLLEELDRKPAPLIRKRFFYSAVPDRGPTVSETELQAAVENEYRPIVEYIVRGIRDKIRVPFTFITSEVFGETAWAAEYFVPFMRKHGLADSMFSAWAASPGRAIMVNLKRWEDDPPFSRSDRTLTSLMLRALAPLLDREIFLAHNPFAEYDLTERQKEVLAHILQGRSVQEIASTLHRSLHTIHHFVQQLYGRFEVSSRGELMAVFIDKAVMRAAAAAHVE